MKFSVNWLSEFVDLPESIEELVELLTLAGVEIEGVDQRGTKIDNLVVAKIVASSQHPHADRLSVCEVDDGSGKKRQIVCGAKNYKVGDKVPVALPGAKLPDGTEIRQSKLRGIESEGMLCSAIELGLGEDASGLLILSPDAKVGAPIVDLFPPDTILDVEITPNRGDLLSHYGLAREVAALTGASFRAKRSAVEESRRETHGKTSGSLDFARDDGVKISALRECPFFSARRIENVKVGPSPQWLRTKIESVGMRSINNIVDVSNFVMAEFGQPTHAFDADKLQGGINVRLARDGEKFLALDGKTYSLRYDNLVVADQERAVGIAGVMGGEETGVTESTTNILLESAYFLPSSVRRTARELNLSSDASYRFERGVDPSMVLRASERAAELIHEIAAGIPAKEITIAGELPKNPADVSFSQKKCDQLLGITIEPKIADQILERFGLSKTRSKSEEQLWKIPSYRRDLRRDVDLIEEVVRAYGVQKISGTDRSRFTPTSKADREYDWEASIRERLAAHGLSEARTSKLIPRNALAFSENALELRNPLSEDHVALRPSLISGLMGVLERNIRAGAEKVAVFELGRAFIPPSGKEERHLAILLWGDVFVRSDWRSKGSRRLDLFDLKGALNAVVPALSFRKSSYPDFALAVEVWSSDRMVGFAGQIAAARVSASGAVFVAELHADLFLGSRQLATTFREMDRFPAITRDIAMIVPENISHEKIEHLIRDVQEPLLENVELFDLFAGSEIGPARKSLAYSLTYRDRNRTLTSEEVTAAHAKIRERLQREIGAELRE
jgi:phenylalanyl-tRNA synthetase beta chain